MSRIHVKENSKIIWHFAHIPMYTVLGVKPAYIHEKGFKSRVWQFLHVFRDDIGNIKGTKMVHGFQRVYKGRGKAIKVWSTMCGKISCNRCPLMCEVRWVIWWAKYIINLPISAVMKKQVDKCGDKLCYGENFLWLGVCHNRQINHRNQSLPNMKEK